MGLLVTALVWAVFVAIALWLPIRGGPVGFSVFVLTMAVNEIPLVLLVVFALSVTVGLADPSVREGPAAAGIAVSCVVALALIWLQVRARTTRPALEAALAHELGPGWRKSIVPPPARPTGTRSPWLPGIFLPLQRRTRGVERIRSLRYAPGGRTHLLDLYRRRGDESARPILIHLHGGGFVQGNKSRESVVLLNQLASNGWVCLSANYRLRAQSRFPNPLIDTKRVITWARAHAAEYGADPTQIFLVGGSAGGHLALSAALTPNDPRYQPGFEDTETSVQRSGRFLRLPRHTQLGRRCLARESCTPGRPADPDHSRSSRHRGAAGGPAIRRRLSVQNPNPAVVYAELQAPSTTSTSSHP